MEEVSKRVKEFHWGSNSIVLSKPHVFTYAQCYGFLSHEDCLACYNETRTKLPKCLPNNSARIYLDGCFLRYDTYSFFTEALNEKHDTVKCGLPTDVSKDKYIEVEFGKRIDQVVRNVIDTAVANEGYALKGGRGGVEAVYAMAQCWKTMDSKRCKECLFDAGSKMRQCAPATDGRAMNAGCYLRYSTEKFFSNGPVGESKFVPNSSKVGIIIAGVLSAIALFMLALFGSLLGYKRISLKKRVQNNLTSDLAPMSESNLNFKYDILEKATNSFDESRKLGQGGAGSVFKGTLPDGRIVAVKRLLFNTRQWVDEFFNEVNLISAKDTVHILNWKQRFDIISGTAEGLAYLHGGCGEKIIHRDIKSSNILLDENLIPKIADFGLARCVGSDNSHITTGIAGTLGYMAPEYLVRGQLTEKTDVYAFGVLALEIACGRKNSIFAEGSNSILLSVWKHYKADNITESIDPSLKRGYPVKEVSNVLQIGLLCTQSSHALRPYMSEVVQMLTNEEYVIPLPTQAPFLNASILGSGSNDSNGSSARTSNSNWQTTTELSYYYSDHSSTEQLTTEVYSFHTAESTTISSVGSNSPC
uniref:Protein kinase domain-containing protein n=1 Tax=Fagus sylvatica TaxID=28930 RepID=A0A2N9J1G5_FAGSY